MGQYYFGYVNHNGKHKVFDNHVDNDWQGLKLMEHSWYLNPMVNAISEKLYYSPSQIAWVGDYAEDSNLYKYAYPKSKKYEMLHKTEFTLNGRYLVNHTKKLILDCWEYLKTCMKENEDGWVPHPLPLLTALGNGRGGGDYRGINEDKIGCWAWDLLEIVEWETMKDYIKQGGFKKFEIRFEDK